MQTCIRCVLPASFPGISFNEAGECNFCQARAQGDEAGEKKEYLARFIRLAEECRGRADYDCTLAYSGGKDSTYTLYLLREVFHLRVLAVTFDNGFISEQAFRNIRTVTERLGTDSMIFKADFSLLKTIFAAAARSPLYADKTLERASTICTSCIGLAKSVLLKIALEKRIPLTVWGWTPGQAPLRSAIFKTNPAFFRATQNALRAPMAAVAGPAVDRYFLNDAELAQGDRFPYNVSLLAFMDYNERDILATIARLGWTAPEEVDGNSTNCLLNSLANRVHLARHGFHPYAFEIAGMVRSGAMSRAEGLAKLNENGKGQTVAAVMKKLAMPAGELEVLR